MSARDYLIPLVSSIFSLDLLFSMAHCAISLGLSVYDFFDLNNSYYQSQVTNNLHIKQLKPKFGVLKG